jgi:hypothetical protein
VIIKSHIRGGYRAAADYLKAFGKNEKIRIAEISDMDAGNLDEAFHKMWEVASNSKVKKPLHHISINPFWDERLTDAQVLKIVERCEEKYGYKLGEHQRVIVEHIRDGRQHFHVIWNRVSITTGRAVWPGLHWNKSKQAAREMEVELGLKRPIPRRLKRAEALARVSKASKNPGHKGRLNTASITGNTNKTKGIRSTAIRAATKRSENATAPVKPAPSKKWPEAAVIDWEVWGQKDPPRFFAKWPELAPDGFVPFSGGPTQSR